ncbi:MAG TPA: hypothetical protein VFO36_09105, partial [Nitrospiraceae bacterium]|nr:hypothetical protein [Nitrospiraceae bacterium]
MKPHIWSAVGIIGALAFLPACADKPTCLEISKDEAIALAVKARPEVGRNIEGVELRNIADPAAIVAIVTFRSHNASAPKALVYGDSVVEWT